jgi:uncharacterized protein (UPF0332 family)
LKDFRKDTGILSAKARRFLRSAEQLLEDGDYDSCASRCYYAMFFMAQASLLTKGLSASTHKGVISLFGEHFAKTGILDSQLGRTINYAYDKRVVGDYGIAVSVARDEAEDLLEAAREFMERVREYLDQWMDEK